MPQNAIPLQTQKVLYITLWTSIPLDLIHPWEPTNKELKPQTENALDVVKKDIFKGIAELTLLKKSAVVPPSL